MSCRCDAAYDREGDCPRCSVEPSPLRTARDALEAGQSAREVLELLPPDLPDGPDELLTLLAEMERALERDRAELESDGGARRCYYCRGKIPPGDGAGVHEACLPAELPEGARSCAGCGELVLDDDDEFEHDFCATPSDDAALGDEAEDDAVRLLELVSGEDDDEPTEPMLVPFGSGEAPLRATDAVRCTCGRWHPYELVAPLRAVERQVLSAQLVDCSCGTRISLCHSWARGCVASVRYERRGRSLN